MEDCVEIVIGKCVGSNLGMRFSAEEFFAKLSSISERNIIVNFENVVFMSRSFANEYLQQKRRINKNIIEINVPELVNELFSIVENSSREKEAGILKKQKEEYEQLGGNY